MCTGLKLTVKCNDVWDESLAAWSVKSLVNTPANVSVWSVYLLFFLADHVVLILYFSDWFLLRNNNIIINFMQECAAYFFYILVCQETLPILENVGKKFLDKSLLPWPKKLAQPRIMMKKERFSMRSIMSAGQKPCSVALRWALIVRDRARYHTIEQRLIDIMILGCLSFFSWPG